VIEPGRRADLVLIDGDPLQDIRATRSIRRVWCGGPGMLHWLKDEEVPMSLHGLQSVTIGVPNTAETGAYYSDFGLTPEGDGWYSTADAGRQLRIVAAPTRRLVEMRVGADDRTTSRAPRRAWSVSACRRRSPG